MALIHYSDLAGETAAFNSDNFIRLRPTHGDSEPTEAVTIRTDKKRFHSKSSPDELVTQLSAVTDMVQLTTPVGIPVWIAKDRLIDVVPTSANLHHPEAKSVLTLHVKNEPTNGPPIDQQVRETVEEVEDAFNNG